MAEISHFHCQAIFFSRKTTEEGIEELQEVTASLAPAKEISEEAAVAAGGRREKQRTSLKAFLMGNMFFVLFLSGFSDNKNCGGKKTVGHHH